MYLTRLLEADAVWRPHRPIHDHGATALSWGVGWRWCSRRMLPGVVTMMGLFLAVLLVGIGPAVGADATAPPVENCPCPEMTVTNIVTTGADGGCVDVPPAVTFTREGNYSVYIASRNLCTVSDPTHRRVEWMAIETHGEYEACRAVIRQAADQLGIPCTDTYHPTPDRDPTLASPSS